MRWHHIALLLAVAVVCSAQTPRYATEVANGTVHVQNPDYALGKPDDKYAGVEYYGILDLAIPLANGEGNDFAVYAKRPQVGILPETMAYAVFVKSGDGDWIFLGVGGGETRPESFELGDLGSADKIRIIFKDPRDVEIVKPLKPYPRDYVMEIDAVEALH